MIDGGQQITGIDTHLLKGSELFDSDPKGALAAYYEAVSLEPNHVEGWNQIGRLMFDMQQYVEAEMVFKRVEQLSVQQGLDDWAEMATQNIELTRQTLAEAQVTDQAALLEAETDEAMGELAQPELAAELPASEETQSIADISNIADAEQAPAADETGLLQPDAVREIVEDSTNGGQQLEAPSLAVMETPAIASPIMKASAQTIEVVEEANPAPVSVQIPAVNPVVPALANQLPPANPALGSDQEPVVMEVNAPPLTPAPTDPSELVGQFAPEIPPMTPAAQMPFGEHQKAALTVPDPQAVPPVPPMPNPTQTAGHDGQSAPSPMPPANPFPAQADAAMAAPLAREGQIPHPPSMVPPTADAAMEAPKSSSGKMALMITGVVGAVGIGIGAAQYLNTGKTGDDAVPVIKSEVKLESKPVVTAAVAPEPEIVKEVAVPAPEAPKILDQDRAYKTGMTHLVKGEFEEARPFLEKAAEAGHAEAAFNLASLYAKGDGVEQNYEKAVSYLKKSSNGGYYPAMTNLGLLYAKGQGVEQNYLTARSLWLKAAAGEHADAMHNLAVIYATGKGVEKDMGEAIKWYRKGANAGYVDSIFDLGLLYANGNGVDRDYPEAKRLWETAAGKGHKLASKNLVKLNAVMAQ